MSKNSHNPAGLPEGKQKARIQSHLLNCGVDELVERVELLPHETLIIEISLDHLQDRFCFVYRPHLDAVLRTRCMLTAIVTITITLHGENRTYMGLHTYGFIHILSERDDMAATESPSTYLPEKSRVRLALHALRL